VIVVTIIHIGMLIIWTFFLVLRLMTDILDYVPEKEYWTPMTCMLEFLLLGLAFQLIDLRMGW
jgi:hypothetical protein